MRVLARVSVPMEKESRAPNSEAFPETMRSAMERLKPESAYFFEEDGKRECLFVFNLDIPSLLKPLFPHLGASFHVTPVMNAAEFGLGAAGKQRGEQQLGGALGKQPLAEESAFLADIRPVATGNPLPKPAHGVWINPDPLPEDEPSKKP